MQGIAAGLRAHELDPTCEITLVLADEFPNYSICGLPFYLSGETPDRHSLAHRTEFLGIKLLPNHTAESIDAASKVVQTRRTDGSTVELSYDKLLVATGARPVRPTMEGLDLPWAFPLHTMEDSFAFHRYLEEHKPQSAVIVGAGYIGLEMADALVHRGIKVTVASRTETVLATVDASFGERVAAQLKLNGVEVWDRVQVDMICKLDDGLRVTGSSAFEATADLVLVAVGVQPNSELGRAAGVPTGANGALQVNRCMETALRDIYAAGDCVETWHRILRKNTYLPFGTRAHKQGRLAAGNVIGNPKEYGGSLGTQVVKLLRSGRGAHGNAG
jgi:NADPH-dependent 2,4-dienoyl-CoA reductase/sulfur reductase-like enzyme